MIGTVMEIRIKKIRTEILTGNASGVINTYKIIQNGKEFFLSRTSRAHGNSIGIVGQKGILYVDSEDNRVHRQVVAPSGACGLYTDDEPVNGLSSWALRGIIMAEERNETREITIISEDDSNRPIVIIEDKIIEFS